LKKVVGVKFKQVGKIYHFECCNNEKYEVGSKVIVETARGIEYATVAVEQKLMSEEKLIHPLKPILRIANYDDIKTYEKNLRDASEAMEICRQKVAQHGLDMNLIDNEYTFDKTKLIFYFTADGRVDFRELVRDLASVFRTRIELRQIGVRDEAKKLETVQTGGEWEIEVETVRSVTNAKGKESKKSEKTRYRSDLIPAALLTAQYFAAEQEKIDALTAELEQKEQEMESLLEEHGGEDGLLAAAQNDKGKITKAGLKAALKDDPAEEEKTILQQYGALLDAQGSLKATSARWTGYAFCFQAA